MFHNAKKEKASKNATMKACDGKILTVLFTAKPLTPTDQFEDTICKGRGRLKK